MLEVHEQPVVPAVHDEPRVVHAWRRHPEVAQVRHREPLVQHPAATVVENQAAEPVEPAGGIDLVERNRELELVATA